MRYSEHYLKDRFLRNNIINFFGGPGNVIKTIASEKHVEIELKITDNAIMEIYNASKDMIITQYFITPSLLMRVWPEAPIELIEKANYYQKIGCMRKFK